MSLFWLHALFNIRLHKCLNETNNQTLCSSCSVMKDLHVVNTYNDHVFYRDNIQDPL